MSDAPIFQRSPRLHADVPEGEVEIPAPPQAPTEPSMSVASVLFSLVPGLLASLVIYFFARSSGGSSLYMLYSVPMMAAGTLVHIGQFYLQKRKYEADVILRQERYRAALQEHRANLLRSRDEHRSAARLTDPDPAGCLERVAQRDARLWERSPGDADFLWLRLGLGKVQSRMVVKVPRPHNTLDIDPLFQEAQQLATEFGEVPGVPIGLPLREAGVAGMVGERAAVLNAARTLIMQVAAHHSPDEVKLAVVFPASEAEDWAWLRWLPHVWSDDRQHRFLAAEREGADALAGILYDLLNRRKMQNQNRNGGGNPAHLPVFVCLIADPHLVQNEPVVPLIMREGGALGACAMVLAHRKEDLPMECRAIVQVGSPSRLIQTGPSSPQTDFLPDDAPVGQAEAYARQMAPMRLRRMASSAEIPRKVTLLETLGFGRVEESDVLARWQTCEPYRSLAVPVGARAGGETLFLDLHEKAHGPHGLAAGATGSGKSELLQTLIASLAVSFHPHDVAFVMVDYKGGGMANAFKEIPHLVGTITNLEGSLAIRALSALKAELKRRQRLLGDAGVNHIDDYMRGRRQGRMLEPLPHLIVVVDEFAELKAEQPEFMRELISAVRVGRSLGVHLILATQKPAGVVDEQIWSNTRFRLCLRVERPEDSQEVLRCPDAASITGSGRAYFQVGNNERFELFQAGWGGAPYTRNHAATADPYEVAEVGLDGRRYLARPRPPVAAGSGLTQLQALMGYLGAVAMEHGIARLPGPWLPPLPAVVTLSQVRAMEHGWNGALWVGNSPWLEPVVGLLDDPEQQRQVPLSLSLGKEGHLAIYGAPGNGKTTLLQTLLCSLALSHSPGEVHFYLLDCSGRTLALFETLPHTGAVVTVDEHERVLRLLRYLLQELDRRKALLARAGVNTLAAYRQVQGASVPALIVVLDNYPAFLAAFAEEEEMVAHLAREGGNHGIHLVVTANSPSMVRHRVASNITLAVTLTLADRGEYATALGRTGGLEPTPLPGRGLVKGAQPLEFQTALPCPGEAEWERNSALRELFVAMNEAWNGPRPRPVNVLPDVVPLCDVVRLPEENATGLRAGIGLDVESLTPFALDLQEGPLFVIGGPAACGKTTLLRSLVLSLADRRTADEMHVWLVDPGAGELAMLRRLPHVQRYVTERDGLSAAVTEIAERLAERHAALEEARRQGTDLIEEAAFAARYPPLLLVIDDFDIFRTMGSDEALQTLERLIRRERNLGLYVLAAGSSGVLNQYSYEGLLKALKELQTGFVLGSNDHADLQLFNLRPLTGEAGKPLPPGQGYYARRGKARAVKVATPMAGDLQAVRWVAQIHERAKEGEGVAADSGAPR